MLRIIPIGGVFLAVLIVLLALSPPREAQRDVSADMVLARGPLIDRREHPEWPQFLIKAAFQRAGEILKLRDLPDTPTVIAPVPIPPARPVPPVADVIAVPPPQPDIGAREADRIPAGPAAADNKVIAALPAAVDDVKTGTPAAAPTDPAQASSDVPPPAASAPTVEPATALQVDTSSGRRSGEAANLPLPRPPAAPVEPTIRVAVLPLERPSTDLESESVTGAISASNDATMPVDIGETSSTELPIILPRERPPVLRAILREHSSRHRRAPLRPRASAKSAMPSNVQPASQTNLFEWLFEQNKRPSAPKSESRGAGHGTSHAGKTATPAYPPIAYYPITSP